MATLKITDKMADALGCTADFGDDRRVMIMSHPRTQLALAARGLADEHGVLTKNGNAVREYLETHPDQRLFNAGLRTILFSPESATVTENRDSEPAGTEQCDGCGWETRNCICY